MPTYEYSFGSSQLESHEGAPDPHPQYATDVDVAGKVSKSGDTMTGTLYINAANASNIALLANSPNYAGVFFSAEDAKLRWYITKDTSAESGGNTGGDLHFYRYADDGSFLGTPLSIARSTGHVTLQQDPTSDYHVSTKKYADTKVAKTGDTMSGNLIVPDGTTSTHAVNKGQMDTADALRVAKSGDTMTGDLIINKATPRLQLYHPAVGAASIGMNGPRVAIRNETNTALAQIEAATPTSADSLTTKDYVDTADALKVAKSGDTMTGSLNVPTINGGSNSFLRGGKSCRYAGASSETGYIIVELDRDKMMSSMANITIRGFNYASGQGAWEVQIGGYLYAGNPPASWVNPSVSAIGHERVAAVKDVRLLARGGTTSSDQAYAIAIGLSTSTWAYPQVHVYIDSGFSAVAGDTSPINAATVSISTSLSAWTWNSAQTVRELAVTTTTAVTPTTGWADYGGTYAGLRVTKVGDLVTAEGVMKRTSTLTVVGGTEYPFGTIPTGWRPATHAMSVGWSSLSPPCRVRIGSDGTLYVLWISSGSLPADGYVSFNASWRVA